MIQIADYVSYEMNRIKCILLSDHFANPFSAISNNPWSAKWSAIRKNNPWSANMICDPQKWSVIRKNDPRSAILSSSLNWFLIRSASNYTESSSDYGSRITNEKMIRIADYGSWLRKLFGSRITDHFWGQKMIRGSFFFGLCPLLVEELSSREIAGHSSVGRASRW